MVESIYNELKKRYFMGRDTLKWIAKSECNDDDMGEYDIRLLTINIKDIDDNDDDAQPMIMVRLRKDADKDEELVVVCNTKGANRTVTDIDKDLMLLAELIETLTEGLLEEYKDKVLLWNWLGD